MNSRRWAIIAVVILIVWGLTDVRSRGRVDLQHPTQRNVHMTDVTVYTEAGAAIFDGRDPYLVTSPRGWHYLYPPLFAMVLAPLAGLYPQWQVVIWFAVSVLAGWGCFYECRRIYAWLMNYDTEVSSSTGSDADPSRLNKFPIWLIWTTSAGILLPALNCLQRGQVGIVLMYLLLLGTRLTMTAHRWWIAVVGGIVLALPAAIKLTPALPVAFVCWLLMVAAWTSGGRTFTWQCAWSTTIGVVLGLLLFLVALPSAVVGPAQNAQFLSSWMNRVTANQEVGVLNDFNVHSLRNQSFTNSVYLLSTCAASLLGGSPMANLSDDDWKGNPPISSLVDQPAMHFGLLGIQLLLLGWLFAAGWTAARHGERLSMAATVSLACMLTLLISPLSWAHHYVLWLPALWLVPLYLRQQNRPVLALGLSLAACILIWVHYLYLPIAGRFGLLGLGASVWFAIAAMALIRDRKCQQDEYSQEFIANIFANASV